MPSQQINVNCALQGVRHSKPTEVTEEIKAQLKDKVNSADSPLADVIVAAGKQKLSKKPDDKQTSLTSKDPGIVLFLKFYFYLLSCPCGTPAEYCTVSCTIEMCII